MIRTGHIQELQVLSHSNEGLLLGSGTDSALLPTEEIPSGTHDGDVLKVFVYRDRGGERLATTRPPKLQVGEFGLLQVKAIRGAGAHLEWGLEPPLLVPHEEQRRPMEEGRWYVTHVALDPSNDQLYGSTCVDKFLDNTTLSVQRGDQVALLVQDRSPLGYSVIVNDAHHGLVHTNEVFKPISIGDRLTGFVKQVREDNKLDIVLEPIGYRKFIDAHTALLAKRLEARGFLPLSDKSSADEIHAEFGISKKAFKKALGALYKERLVRIGEEGIVWVG